MGKWATGILINLLVTSLAWSQCAPGIPSAGNPGCIPPDQPNSPYYQGDNAQPQGPAQPAAVWADRWGAIAIDSNTGQIGVSANISGMSEAMETALKTCVKNGGPDCKVELSYHNQCAAVAWGSSFHIVSHAPYIDTVKANALRACSQKTQDCKIVYSECSYAVRVQ
jgi:hypothetical protein